VVSNEHPEHSARHGRKEKYAGQNPEEEPAQVPLPSMRLDDCPGLALPDSGEEALVIGPGLCEFSHRLEWPIRRYGHLATEKWPPGRCPRTSLRATVPAKVMDHDEDKPSEDLPEAARKLGPRDLYEIEMYFRQEGFSEFVYDAELDLFRFPEDGRVAFSREFADWKRLRERGYLD
jgi:hypothetical protein